MNKEDIDKLVDEIEITWNCRFHPTDWWHEVGCPHKDWTKEELWDALRTSKKSEKLRQKGIVLSEP
jgi:hypothetical protein